MPAYLIVNYEVEDPALYGEYAKAAGPAMKIGSECQLDRVRPGHRPRRGRRGGPPDRGASLRIEGEGEGALRVRRLPGGDREAPARDV